ncbi:hypothetical protein LR48_Vigan03g092400 [Vigna angularis]|uniref:Uncharacterized protein n=1 Tax=Phaseolus angularis TaxID=3914 RepID=A0A0L9U4F4_PHAAN|nr:hypothetical protein LR48_Vigan03g092400 [Vigna angularis]
MTEGRPRIFRWCIVIINIVIGSSIFGSIERDMELGDEVANLNGNNVVTRDNMGEVVMIDVDATGEWDESCVPMSPFPKYVKASHEVGEYVSCFNTRYSLKKFVGKIALVRVVEDAKHFKFIVCKKNEQCVVKLV